jgi:DNA-binding NarL/FixJ family response regulator
MKKHPSKKRILLVDDHPIVCDGLSQIINHERDMEVVHTAVNAEQALGFLGKQRADCVVTDLALEGKSGLEMIADMHTWYPRIPVLVLSMYDEMAYAERALRAGAQGYVMKRDATEKIIQAIRQVLDGDVYVSDILSSLLLQHIVGVAPDCGDSVEARLSNRELEVFRLTGSGFKTRQIAAELNLSAKTIETYKTNIKNKLNLGASCTTLI